MRFPVFLLVCVAAVAADRPEWDNPAIVHVGTEKPHATMMVYPTAELARTGDRAKSPWFQLLNGTWKFHGSLRPAERPLDFYRTDYNDAAWGTMPVPASWQMHGFDIPIYTNIIYPWPQDPSKPPAGALRFQPRRQLSHALHRAARVEGPPGLPAFRRRRFGLLRVGQRQEARLQRGQPHARRVRPHAAPEARREPAGGRGLPLRRRRLPGRPGHVAHERHLPRRLPLVHARASTCATSRCTPTSTTQYRDATLRGASAQLANAADKAAKVTLSAALSTPRASRRQPARPGRDRLPRRDGNGDCRSRSTNPRKWSAEDAVPLQAPADPQERRRRDRSK